jgi:hypothetical protein
VTNNNKIQSNIDDSDVMTPVSEDSVFHDNPMLQHTETINNGNDNGDNLTLKEQYSSPKRDALDIRVGNSLL